jgi:hypothetical protein
MKVTKEIKEFGILVEIDKEKDLYVIESELCSLIGSIERSTAIEDLILAHVCSGVDIESPEYRMGIKILVGKELEGGA